MMRKIKIVFACLLVAIFGLLSAFIIVENKGNVALAQSEADITRNIQIEIQKELEGFIEYKVQNNLKTRNSRIAGSKAEYKSAMYIKDVLDKLTNYKPVNNQSTEDGVENFEFISMYDGKTYTSQNIVYKRESLIKTDRKVILAAHYDTAYVYLEGKEYSTGKGMVNDGVNDNAASVATLLALTKALDKEVLDYGYDIEIVFFGASYNDYAGSSYYSRGQSEDDVINTLLMINLDRIGLGQYNYAYVNEFKTTQEEYLLSKLSGFKKLNQKNVLDFSTEGPNGLDYTHVGLQSDHISFMERNVNVLSFFSGNYESSFTYGIKEYEEKQNVTFTQKDDYYYILNNYFNFYSNLSNVYKGIDLVLKDNKFIAEMEKPNGLEGKYEFWTNEKMAVFITSVLLVAFVFVYLIIYWALQKKARNSVGKDINTLVIKISENLGAGEKDTELNDAIDQKIKRDTEKPKDEEKEE